MSQVFDLLKQWATEQSLDAAKLEQVLTDVCDEYSIAPKLYGGERLTSGETERVVCRIRAITAKNVKGTSERRMEFADGTTLLYGPNDAGKTTMQETARYALGGGGTVGRIDEDLMTRGADSMLARVDLEDGRFVQRGIRRRVIKKGAKAGQTEVERSILVKLNGHEEDKLGKGEAEISAYLGGDVPATLDLAFLRQGQIAQVMDDAPGVRLEAIFQLLGLASAEETRKRLADALRDLEAKLVTPAAVGHQDRLAAIEKRLAEIEADPSMKEAVDTAPQERFALEKQQERDDQVKYAASLAGQMDALRDRYKEIRDLPPECPTCKALGKSCELTPAAKKGVLDAINAQGMELKKKYEAARGRMDELQKALEMASQQLALARDAMMRRRAGQEEATRLMQEHQAVKQRMAEEATKQKADPEKLAALRTLVDAFSRKGIPLWVARRHAARINELAREIAVGDRYVYQFSPDFDIQILDTKQERALVHPVFASGSARERGALVLLAARSRYLQELSGLVVPFIWVDELAYQDDANAHVVAEILDRLKAWFSTIVLTASRWDAYFEGERCILDNQIGLLPDAVSRALEEQRDRKAELAAEGQGVLAGPAPEVKLYEPAAAVPTSGEDLDAELRAIKESVDAGLAGDPSF